MRYNLPPMCCCFLCLRRVGVTRRRVKVVRALVSQMAYVQILVIFLQQALYHCGLPPSGLSPGRPQTYLLLVGKASFLLGLYGLFFFFTVERTFGILDGFQYQSKFFLMKVILVVFLVQESLLEVLDIAGALPCSPNLSSTAWSTIILCSLLMVETSVLGVISFIVYYRHPSVETKVVALQESQE